MIETFAGAAFGGLLRLAPEVIKVFDRKNEREHELKMQDKQHELIRLQGAERVAEANSAYDKAAVEHLGKVLEAVERPSGVAWVDGLSKSVRPTITLFFSAFYISIKVAAFYSGATLAEVWSPEDSALFAGIVNFWFLGRVFERSGR